MTFSESLIPKISSSPTFQRLLNQVREYEDISNLALSRAARLAVAAALYHAMDIPTLLITDRSDHALTLFDELSLWIPYALRLRFPEPTPLFYERAPWSETTRRDRLHVLTTIAAHHIPGVRTIRSTQSTDEPSQSLSRAEERQQIWRELKGGIQNEADAPPIIVTTVRALMTRTLPRRDFLKNTRNIKIDQVIQPNALARAWVEIGYENTNTVIAPGQFARRGGILDIWPPAEPAPVRIDFFGDEIESLHQFDPATQRTADAVDQILITPAREFIVPTDNQSPTLRLRSGQVTNHQSLVSEFDIPHLHSPASLIDYLPDSALILLDDLDAIEQTSHEIETQSLELRQATIEDGQILQNFPIPYTPWSELFDAVTFKRYLQLGPVTGLEKSDLARMFTPNPRFGGRVNALLDHLLHQTHRGDKSIIVSRQSSRLQELWKAQTGSLPHSLTSPLPTFTQGSLTEGFLFSPPGEKRFHLLTDGEIFGWRRPQPRKPQPVLAEAPETAYADLQTGDWVVHVHHGIGRFMGLVRRTIDAYEREYLYVEYDDGDQLFVPVYQADRLSRYIGPDGRTPSPTRLGGNRWRNAKARAQKAVEHVAEDLLELYARRQVVQGYAFEPDSDWQRELEASFPYTETEDQLQVIEEVKRDMEGHRPMDRLICGDVGYGKTEVALRAAFKAVYDGKQVAMLVPTTVLAQQHYDTFRERLAPFPVKVEMLSRFRTDKEQREILIKLAQGTIDIIIGTHRLLSGDVVVKDLGLLIIDEEQRFGVTHKETLKRMRTEVDILTMTATPIPRTLYMALTGVRDISTINTPPEERLSIVTHVGNYSQKLVRQAILRELERGGQVFFVHNRVQTIWGMRNHVEKLVPEARIGVAHGQMPEKELSQCMRDFTAGEIDVLLSTSIIESGLDIPNANTLLVDRADTFGLAQLYQLRGRVGRGTHQAIAYFFKHRTKAPTPEGRMRLETLVENTQLGAGFSIAMRDLEIRGAGDLLGTNQHGHIAAVGFHLYTRLLAQAIQRLRGSPTRADIFLPMGDLAAVHAPRSLVNIVLPLPAGIPTDYISDQDSRLRLYRRIADLCTLSELAGLANEFRDRFGPPPEEVQHLLYQIKVKLLADKVGLNAIYPENGKIVLRFPKPPDDTPSRAFPYLGNDIRVSKNSVRILRGQQGGDWQTRLVEILQELRDNGENFPN